MGESSKTTVSGIFRSEKDLTEVVNYLELQGISENDISILMSEETQKKHFSIDTVTKAPREAVKGLTAGGLLGALIGGLTLIGFIAIPGTGLIVGGPIVGIITGAAAGGLMGSLIGALIGLGIPEHEAKFYEKAVKEPGNILLVTYINNDILSDIKKIFSKYGAFHIATH